MDNNSLFSTKGFYLGVIIFLFGIILMITRVALEVNNIKKPEETKKVTVDNSINDKILQLQQQLDLEQKKEPESTTKSFLPTVESNAIKVFEHNPVLNNAGNVYAIEFIDFSCAECLADANLVNLILNENNNVRLTSKVSNLMNPQELQTANIAAMVAINKGKFFEYRLQAIAKPDGDLTNVLNNLKNADVSLRDFRRELTTNSNLLLNYLNQDIAQAKKLKLNNYAIYINNRLFSDAENSIYKLKDITVYLNNLNN